jgi:hypothetical protein
MSVMSESGYRKRIHTPERLRDRKAKRNRLVMTFSFLLQVEDNGKEQGKRASEGIRPSSRTGEKRREPSYRGAP